ncbi:dihydrodipicolinate reductase [Listeria monocytogenes]|nr:dihydrodipicolinate reductase [Listeria monocytogenes]
MNSHTFIFCASSSFNKFYFICSTLFNEFTRFRHHFRSFNSRTTWRV